MTTTTTTAPPDAPVPGQYGGFGQGTADPWAFDPGIFYKYSSMVYPVHPTPGKPDAAGLAEANKQQYDYVVQE